MQALALVMLLIAPLHATVGSGAGPQDQAGQQERGEEEFAQARVLLEKHCFECHGEELQRGKRRLDGLGPDFASPASRAAWEDIAAVLDLGDMPPPEAAQPSPAEVRRLVDWIDGQLASTPASEAGSRPRTVLRRLNRVEYRNSLRDLLGIDTTLFDPTEGFPPDETEDGFDNVGEALVTSSTLLEQCLTAADLAVEHALRYATEELERSAPPEPTRQTFRPPFMTWGGDFLPEVVRRGNEEFEDLFTQPTGEYGYLVLDELIEGVQRSGEYRVRVKAAGIDREHEYTALGTDTTQPLRLGLIPGTRREGSLRRWNSSEKLLVEFELADDEPTWHEARVWLEEGFVPRFDFPNGPPVKPSMLGFFNLCHKHHPELLGQLTGPLHSRGEKFLAVYRGPRARVFEVEVEGPLVEEWPPHAHTLVARTETGLVAVEESLVRFAARAFRRPVEAAELAPILAFARDLEEQGASRLDALRWGLKAILCAPDFLYLFQPAGGMDDLALAARLSYFLWSSTPDEALLARAAAGELSDPEALDAEATRMLADPRAAALVDNFTNRWLGLHRPGEMPPDPDRYGAYYEFGLAEAMRTETRLFFQHLLENDLDVGLLLDSDFTFVNGTLAEFYGLDVTGHDFRRVELVDRWRGGLLGHASVLTATANGIDTSPVIRGVWMLENILGTPPSPPPGDFDPLEPDTQGALSLREQLERHRDVPSCYGCHAEIDPMGYAFEHFDPIGRFRTNYGRGAPEVDSSGTLPDGADYEDVRGFRAWLVTQRPQFARCLTEKLLTYATGAVVAPRDHEQITSILADLKREGWGLETLVRLVIRSPLFRQ